MDQTEKFTLNHIYPPLASTIRGEPSSFDTHHVAKKLVYAVSNIIVIRPLDNLNTCTIFDLHKAQTTAVRISASGNLCASGDATGNIFVWEINTPGHPVSKTFENVLGGAIKDISWSNDGQRIIAGGEGKTFFGKVFLTDTGSTVGEINGISKRIMNCDFRPARPFRLAFGGEDNSVVFFEGPPFKFARSSKQHTNYINALRFSDNGEFLISGSSDKKLFLYNGKDLQELKEIKTTQPHSRSITAVRWISDSQFVTSSNDTTLKLWTIKEDEGLVKTFISQHNQNANEIKDMQVSVVVLNGDAYGLSLGGTLNQWKDIKNLADGSLPTQKYYGHNVVVGAIAQDKSGILFTGDYSGKILIWDGQSSFLPEGTGLTKQILGLALSEDEKTLYALGIEELGSINLDTKTYNKIVVCKGSTIGVAVGGSDVFVLLESGVIVVYNSELEKLREISLPYETSAFGVSQKGEFLLVGDKKGLLHVLSSQGQEQHVFQMWGNKINAVVVGQGEGKDWVVAGDSTGKMKLWDFKKNEEIFGEKWVYHTTIITSVSFSKNLKYVVSTAQDNKFMVWSTESGLRLSEKIDAHKKGILTGLVNQNGLIITSGGDNAIKVWKPTIDLN